MTKAEIVSKISEKTGIEKTTALVVVESLMIEVKESIKNKEPVFLRGFGTFLAKERKKKTGRNISKNTTIIEAIKILNDVLYHIMTIISQLWRENSIIHFSGVKISINPQIKNYVPQKVL